MSSETVCQSQFQLDEFVSDCESRVLYYQILKMNESAYIWVGTESGEQGCIVAAVTTRLAAMGGGPRPASALLGGATQDMNIACAGRLQAKLNYPVLLSLNIPQDVQVLEHVERTLLERLS